MYICVYIHTAGTGCVSCMTERTTTGGSFRTTSPRYSGRWKPCSRSSSISIHMYKHTHTHTHTYIHISVSLSIYLLSIYLSTYLPTYLTYVCLYMFICMYIIYIYIYEHVCMACLGTGSTGDGVDDQVPARDTGGWRQPYRRWCARAGTGVYVCSSI